MLHDQHMIGLHLMCWELWMEMPMFLQVLGLELQQSEWKHSGIHQQHEHFMVSGTECALYAQMLS